MRLMYRINNQWVQLFTDSSLDRYANLSDLEDITKAKENLQLAKDYWNKEELLEGERESIIHNVCIIQDPNARFVTDDEKAFWNQKVDQPITSNTQPTNLTDGQIWFDPSTNKVQIMINGKLRYPENNLTKSGTANFKGGGQETTVLHQCVGFDGSKKIPNFISITPVENPQGTLGETWVRKDNTNFYVGNTGSYTGKFDYIVFYEQ